MKINRKADQGFTMVELMYVVSIIGVLAAIAIPQFSVYRHRAILVEGDRLSEPIKKDILEYYAHTGKMPVDNKSCGQPQPEFIKGKYVASIAVKHGDIHVRFNDTFSGGCENKINIIRPELQGDTLNGIFTWKKEECK